MSDDERADFLDSVRQVVRDEIRKGVNPCTCGLRPEHQNELGHLVGMFKDVGIESARDRLKFVGMVQDGVCHAKKAGIATAVGALFLAITAGLVLLFKARVAGG